MEPPIEGYNPNRRSGVQDGATPHTPPRQKPTLPKARRKTPWLVAAAALVVLVAFVAYLWPKAIYVAPTPERTIPVSSSTPTPDLRTKVNEAYGPWRIVNKAADAPKSILLIGESGNLQAGKELSGIPESSWKTSSSPYIMDKTMNLKDGTVTFRTNANNVVTVLANQPFILERSLTRIYKFNNQGYLVETSIGV